MERVWMTHRSPPQEGANLSVNVQRLPRQNEMNLRNTTRRLLVGLDRPPNLSQSATIIIVVMLALLAGFTIVKFMLNFDQLQRLAEYNRTTGDVQTSSEVRASIAPEAAGASTDKEPSQAAWLDAVNRYRAMVGLAPVTADDQLSRGDLLHSHYLAANYSAQLPDLRLGADAHTEDPAKPGFTVDGAAAARTSDIDWSWGRHRRWRPAWAINNWMQVPFHRMQIISPYLRKVGYGTDCEGAVCFAALNTGIDVEQPPALPSRWSQPLMFPPDGSLMDSGEFSAEWPNPLTSCPGYTSPAGLPITLELGHLVVPGFSDYSLVETGSGTPLEACAFDANTYVNPDSTAQANGRAILREFGAITIVPRTPLSPGRYMVRLTAGHRYLWSFSVLAQSHE
jgi:Cysteine-rich secretory protein family